MLITNTHILAIATITTDGLTWAALILVCAGYAYSSEPPVLHDTCNSWMFVCLHAPGVHASELHCLCIGTSAGQGHGRTFTCTWNRQSRPFSKLIFDLCSSVVRQKLALSWTSWALWQFPSLWTRGVSPCLTWAPTRNGHIHSISRLLLLTRTLLPWHSMLLTDNLWKTKRRTHWTFYSF